MNVSGCNADEEFDILSVFKSKHEATLSCLLA